MFIPKIIHISWKTDNILEIDHPLINYGIANLTKLSPDWRIDVSTDDTIDSYLKSNLDKRDYDLLKDKHVIEKLDVWRLIKLYKEGGIYLDIDRLCNISLEEAIPANIKCVLPTCLDNDFSHDFMCSAPNNPIFAETLQLNLARRYEGHTSIYYLGPQTYMHGITKCLLGTIVDVSPDKQLFNDIRSYINSSSFMYSYREHPPLNTIIYKSNNFINHESMKRDFYKYNNIKHWTGEW